MEFGIQPRGSALSESWLNSTRLEAISEPAQRERDELRPGQRGQVGPEEVAEASRECEKNERREVADDVRPCISHVLAHARGARRAAVFYHHARVVYACPSLRPRDRLSTLSACLRRVAGGFAGKLPAKAHRLAFGFQIIDYDRKYP